MKWLRIMGFDTCVMPDWDEALVGQALAADRRVLTRRRRMEGRPGVILIRQDKVMDQLRELAARIDLKDGAAPYSRCSRCNRELEGMNPPEVRGRVPEYVFQTRDHFMTCPECRRIYWEGSHRDRVAETLKYVLG